MKSYSLFELNEYIRRVLALNFAEALWISCEIAQINKAKGNYYLELIQKSEDGEKIIASSAAIIWQKKYFRLRANLGKELDTILQEGMAIMAKFRIDFHERYGLKLIVEEIDLSYSLGKLALKRRDTIEELRTLGLLEKNKALNLPIVLQNIAVISSHRAAGYQDFIKHLKQNEWNYKFNLNLYSAAVQGVFASDEMLHQLHKITESATIYDLVVIIRGGGAKLDLIAFDDLELCKTVATMKMPVITGIGHEVDATVMDLVAHTSLKTPTAVASFILDRNLQYESQLLHYGYLVGTLAQEKIKEQNFQIENATQKLRLFAKQQILQKNQWLNYKENELRQASSSFIKMKYQELDALETNIKMLDPLAILKRGYSITMQKDKVVRDAKKLKDGTLITSYFEKGKLDSIVKK